MRIVCLCNNRLGYQALNWLRAQQAEIVALVVHPEARGKYRREIIEESGLPPDRIFAGDKLREDGVLRAISALKPDLGLSVLFGYILKRQFLSLFPQGVINLHPAYLPYNKGAYPNVWSIVEGTPAGATLHYVDEGIDTGRIIARSEVTVEPVDTGGTLYAKLEDCAFRLLTETWQSIVAGNAQAVEQTGGGTYHHTRDVEQIDRIDLDRQYTARELIDIIRARTFPPYKGAYIEVDGKKVYLDLKLSSDETSSE